MTFRLAYVLLQADVKVTLCTDQFRMDVIAFGPICSYTGYLWCLRMCVRVCVCVCVCGFNAVWKFAMQNSDIFLAYL